MLLTSFDNSNFLSTLFSKNDVQFLTMVTQQNARTKIALWGYFLVLSIKEFPVKYAKVWSCYYNAYI